MIKQTKKLFFKLLEEELTAVLAILILGVGALFVHAGDTGTSTMTVTILPAGGSITVTAPDGGESWTVNSNQNITWTTLGSITDVKIELQRTTGGSWETIVDSTTNDGSYPWTVTSPTTSTAKIKISKVGDDTIYDESNSTFTIASAGGGGTWLPQPGIDNVVPQIITNQSEVILDITGVNFKPTLTFQLDRVVLKNVKWISSTRAQATVPAGLGAGNYRLWIYNNDGTYNYWGTLIQVIDQRHEARGVAIPEVIKLYMQPGERQEVKLELINTGNLVWGHDLKLGTVDPQDRESIFYDPISWPSRNRAASYSGKSLGYGGKAALSFYMKAPDEVGQYVEKFSLVLEGQRWLEMLPITFTVLVTSKEKIPELPTTGGELFYSAKWVGQSLYPTLKPGQTAEMWVEFKNTGTLPWYSTGVNPVRLGTSNPLDRTSVFLGDGWILKNRPAVVTITKANGYTINPGEIGRFTFKITAPTKLGKYREYFRPVVEYKEWLPDYGVYWDITVTSGVIKTTPSTGGESTAKFPTAPRELSEFQDVTERFLRSFTQTIGRLFGSIGNLFSGWF